MIPITPFAQKVLAVLEPDPDKYDRWLKEPVLAGPCASPAMQAFVSRIEKAVENREKVLVAGDYDCDGILATSILTDGLRSLGLETGYYIPNRIEEGYGLKSRRVQDFHDKGYSLIVTVDNGIKAFDALDKALELGMDVIVTDHHTFDEPLDERILVVHPDTLGEDFSTLCGAGVAFECLRALHADKPRHLIWAAVASIGDCMPVTCQTRAIISQGLKTLNESQEYHIQALSKAQAVDETEIAFQVVPKINSVGRLADRANANNIVKYFLQDPATASAATWSQISNMAQQMVWLNDCRKQMSDQMYVTAKARLQPARPVLLVEDESFHEGIIGLVAGQLCSQYKKPAIVAACNAEGFKCSMRAPEGFDCMEFLQAFDQYSALGGHKLAAGFSVDQENWEAFKKFVFRHGLEYQWSFTKRPCIPLDPNEATVENIESLNVLRPFGVGFESPLFEIENPNITGVFDMSQGKHRKFTLNGKLAALNFNQSPSDLGRSVVSIKKLVGTLSINQYQGRKQPNFIIEEIEYY